MVSCILGCAAAFGQWSNDPAKNLLIWGEERSFYSSWMAPTPQGNLWLALDYPAPTGVHVALTLLDTAGNYLFDEPIYFDDYQTRTWTSYSDVLYVDNQGNAIIAIYDQRFSDEGYESYTVYKVSQEGELLWGKNGISLESEDRVYDLCAAMKMVQLSDNSYVFAWMHNRPTNLNMMSIEMQRLSEDGELLWNADDMRFESETTSYQYPFLVDAGMGQVILIYAKGTSQDLYARKIDFDGTSVWSEDTRVYNGGWGSIPIWTLLSVSPAGDGGAILSWNDDRYFTNIESAYMAYLKPNGELGFPVDNGQKLGYNEYLRSLSVRSAYDKNSDSFYAIWNETSSGQSWNRVVAQRVSRDGELMWSENGLELKPLEQIDYGYFSIQSGINDEVVFFYQCNYNITGGDVENIATAVNVNDTLQRRETIFTKSTRVSEKAQLESTPMFDGKFWILKWEDSRFAEDEESIDRLFMQRLNNDFTIGNPADAAVERVEATNNTFVALANIVENEAMFAVNVDAAVNAKLSIYNMNGALVATPFDGMLNAGQQYICWSVNAPAGIYLATLTTANGTETVKILVK